jgi:preprotein translocase subunit SecG
MVVTLAQATENATRGWPSWLMGVLIVIFIFACVLMILTVLIQKPQGGGLAGAFGGGSGSGQTAFGTKTGDALTVLTIIVFTVFLAFAIALNFGVKSARGPIGALPAAESPAGTPSSQPADSPTGGAPAAPAGDVTPPTEQPVQITPEQPASQSPAPISPAPQTPAPQQPVPQQPAPQQPASTPQSPPVQPTPAPSPK